MDEYIAIKKPSKEVLDYLQWAAYYAYDNARVFWDRGNEKERDDSSRWLKDLEKVCQYNKPITLEEQLAKCLAAKECLGLYTDCICDKMLKIKEESLAISKNEIKK